MPDWLEMAKDAYDGSTSYINNNMRKKWDDAVRHFNGEHASGSKYHGAVYNYRSKIFRPKTRSSIRANEAAAMVAFFGNEDVVNITARNPDIPIMQASAEIWDQILQYRLTESIPWFLICIGAFQEAQKVGAVCSHIFWEYVENKTGVVKDQPCIELVPIENIRIDPAADWVNPVNSSPYVIHLMPMYLKDVKRRMEKVDAKTGESKWIAKTDQEIMEAHTMEYNTTQQERNQRMEDPFDEEKPPSLKNFDTVWVHKNIFNDAGTDYLFYTLGTRHLLSNPVPLESIYLHGRRPYVIGNSVICAHDAMPDGLAGIGKPMQQELNEIANARLDNVKMVLNKRWVVKRGQQVDINSILRNAAGSVTMANNPKEDIMPVEFNDVTGSSYQEQDRLNLDYDELVGTFSPSTVQTNRRMNETVGGMQMIKGGAQILTEYVIRTFSETWVEPVLKQLLQLEMAYETDIVVMSTAAEKAKVLQKYGVNAITDELLNQRLTLEVNVGSGATDPQARLQRLLIALESLAKAAAMPLPNVDLEEVGKEVFSALGWKNPDRFIFAKDSQEYQMMSAQMQQMQQQIQDLQGKIDSKQLEQMTKLKIAGDREKAQGDRHDSEMQTRIVEKIMDTANDDDRRQQQTASKNR